MPKRITPEQKRVPLNCLIDPKTRAEIKKRAVKGKSQGEVVDEAVRPKSKKNAHA